MPREFHIQKARDPSAAWRCLSLPIWLSAPTPGISFGATEQQELALMMRNRDLLKKDIQRAREIRGHIPAIRKTVDAFEQSLFPENTAYSGINAELDSLAANPDCTWIAVAFKQARKGHDLTELEIDAQVSGDYRGVVRFLKLPAAFHQLLCG